METGSVYQEFNIAEILRYAPKGLKLYSPLFGEVDLSEIENGIIRVENEVSAGLFNHDGRYYDYPNAECLLFPSINHRCWNHWQNTLFLESIGSVCVDTITGNKFILDHNGTFFSDGTGSQYSTLIDGDDIGNYLLNSRYATPEETKEFFEELEKNGYTWDGKMVVKKEQNKPKFHEGDWVVYMGTTAKILDLQEHYYVGKDINDKDFVVAYSNEYEMKKWTIDDAKDGDVLISRYNQPFIFNGKYNNYNVGAYCGIDYLGEQFIDIYSELCWSDNNSIKPATKEQRDLLFQKMHEAGFEWNADTKKLIKTTIPIPKFKEGDVIKHTPTGEIAIIKHICSDYYVLDKGTSLYFESQDMWELIASKVKPTLEEKVNILADEILALKERVKALEIQAIKQCSDKNRLDSLESKMIILDSHNINNRLDMLESRVFPIPDIYKSSDKAGG